MEINVLSLIQLYKRLMIFDNNINKTLPDMSKNILALLCIAILCFGMMNA